MLSKGGKGARKRKSDAYESLNFLPGLWTTRFCTFLDCSIWLICVQVAKPIAMAVNSNGDTSSLAETSSTVDTGAFVR